MLSCSHAPCSYPCNVIFAKNSHTVIESTVTAVDTIEARRRSTSVTDATYINTSTERQHPPCTLYSQQKTTQKTQNDNPNRRFEPAASPIAAVAPGRLQPAFQPSLRPRLTRNLLEHGYAPVGVIAVRISIDMRIEHNLRRLQTQATQIVRHTRQVQVRVVHDRQVRGNGRDAALSPRLGPVGGLEERQRIGLELFRLAASRQLAVAVAKEQDNTRDRGSLSALTDSLAKFTF